jgi:hypothetical protein
VIARQSAYFLLAFANIGLMPDGGATALVPAAVGRARAARMALLGERIAAQTAFDWGLISHVVGDDDFDAEVAALTAKLANGPTRAYAHTKVALNLALPLAQAHATELAGQRELFATDDFAEGILAFHEHRAARFRGRRPARPAAGSSMAGSGACHGRRAWPAGQRLSRLAACLDSRARTALPQTRMAPGSRGCCCAPRSAAR